MAYASFYVFTIKTVVSLKRYCGIVQLLTFHIADRCGPVLVSNWHCFWLTAGMEVQTVSCV